MAPVWRSWGGTDYMAAGDGTDSDANPTEDGKRPTSCAYRLQRCICCTQNCTHIDASQACHPKFIFTVQHGSQGQGGAAPSVRQVSSVARAAGHPLHGVAPVLHQRVRTCLSRLIMAPAHAVFLPLRSVRTCVTQYSACVSLAFACVQQRVCACVRSVCVNSTSANHKRRLGFDFALRTNVRNLEYVDVSLSPLAICGAVFRRAHSHVCRDWSDVAPELVQKGSAVGSVKRYAVGHARKCTT